MFKKEVFYAQNLFDQRFDTKGRSTLLINNNETDKTLPLANYLNLEKNIERTWVETMNTEEDVLFLFLTGHGMQKIKVCLLIMAHSYKQKLTPFIG